MSLFIINDHFISYKVYEKIVLLNNINYELIIG